MFLIKEVISNPLARISCDITQLLRIAHLKVAPLFHCFLSLQGQYLKKSISRDSLGNTSMVKRHTEAGFGSGTGDRNRHCHVQNKCDHRSPGAAITRTPHACLVSTNGALSGKAMLSEAPSISGFSSRSLCFFCSYISAHSRLIFSFCWRISPRFDLVVVFFPRF